jgi:hypothetical protein
VQGCLEFPLQVNFKNRLLGDAPNPKIIPVAGMAAHFIQTLFGHLFTDGDKMCRRDFSIPRECVAATNMAF